MLLCPEKRLLVSAVVALVLAFHSTPARADGIPPGQEASVATMLGSGAELPGGCTWDGASIDKDRISSWYLCPGVSERLLLRLALRPEEAGGRTPSRRFDLTPEHPDVFPRALLDDLDRRVEGGEKRVEVASPQDFWSPKAQQFWWPRGTEAVLIGQAALTLLSIGLLIATRRKRHAGTPFRTGVSVVTIAMLLFGLFQVGQALSRFRFFYDDYMFLHRAMTKPWEWDSLSRFLSVSCYFRGGLALADGRPAWFMAGNALAFGCCLLVWVLLLRRTGFRPFEAALAGAWFMVFPAKEYLLRWGAGIENMGAALCIFGVLLLSLHAREETASRWRQAGFIGAALALASLGMLVKSPWMVVLPPAVWIWHLWLVPAGSHPRRHWFAWGLPFALTAVMAPPALLIVQAHRHGGGMAGWLGWDHVGANARVAGVAVLPWFGAMLLLGVLLAIGQRLGRRPPSVDPVSKDGATREPLRWAAWLMLAAILVAPSLLNSAYYRADYVLLASAPLAVLGARLSGWVDLSRVPRWWQLLATGAALALVIPPAPNRLLAEERVSAFVSEAAQVLETHPEPDRVVFHAECSSPVATKDSAQDLSVIFGCAGGGRGIAFMKRWKRATMVLAGAEPSPTGPGEKQLSVTYCQGQPLRLDRSE